MLCRWFRGWEAYVGINKSNDDLTFSVKLNGVLPHTSCRPGTIDNSVLLSDEIDGESNVRSLRRNLREGVDYCLVPQEVWKKLHEWYLFYSLIRFSSPYFEHLLELKSFVVHI